MGLTEDPNEARNSGIDPNTGLQRKYLVLSEQERAKGFQRPLRTSYLHAPALGGCGSVTVMHRSLAETYAREPEFYTHTFCVGCRTHYPVGEDGQFYWEGTEEKVGT